MNHLQNPQAHPWQRVGLILLLLAGCAAPPPATAPEVHPVDGVVYAAGRPASRARVTFHPLAPVGPPRYPVGTADASGRFRLTTFAAGDGAPPGEYAVTVLWIDDTLPIDECECADPTQHDRLHGQYADPTTTTLRATVVPGSNTVQLLADPGSRGWNLPRRLVDPRPQGAGGVR